MRTTTHFLLTAELAPPVSSSFTTADRAALLAGAVAPDFPLGLLTAGFLVDRHLLRPHLPDKKRCGPAYNKLYFQHPLWIVGHNLLHAPLILFVLALIGWRSAQRSWGRRLFWFATGCVGHSAIDIFTHADDGPLLFFPLEWRTRLHSPFSYWDPEHYGAVIGRLAAGLDSILFLRFLWRGLGGQ